MLKLEEKFTAWGKAKAILRGKSRGRNLIILGIFLVVTGGISKTFSSAFGLTSELGTTLMTLGTMAFVWGAMSYIFWEK